MALLVSTGRDPQPRGVYDAILKSVEERTSGANGGSYFLWTWVAHNRRGDEVTFTATSSLKFGPEAKPRKWVHALLGRELTKDEARAGLNTDELEGLPCKLVIGIVEREGGVFNQVEAVLPAIDLDD